MDLNSPLKREAINNLKVLLVGEKEGLQSLPAERTSIQRRLKALFANQDYQRGNFSVMSEIHRGEDLVGMAQSKTIVKSLDFVVVAGYITTRLT